MKKEEIVPGYDTKIFENTNDFEMMMENYLKKKKVRPTWEEQVAMTVRVTPVSDSTLILVMMRMRMMYYGEMAART